MNLYRLTGIALFLAGLLLSFVLAGIFFWPDMEASLFDTSLRAEKSIDSMRCPLIITEAGDAAVRASFTNPVDRPVDFLVRTRITDGYVTLFREYREVVELAAGETRTLSWPVAPADAAYDRIVLARIYSFRSFPMPAMDAACGSLVIHTSILTGGQLVAAAIGASWLLLLTGGFLWWRAEQPLSARRRPILYAAFAVAIVGQLAMGAAIIGSWGVGVLLILLTIIVVVALAEHFLL
ncbi:MAG: hypothetical protein R3272_15785 [Candidatus Promineifilaceae bacterium]|nr:hypothetical protein [Candidatus Promineifilaceae bacterium]